MDGGLTSVGLALWLCKFQHSLNLSVTDPAARDVFGTKEEGHYPLNDVYLCISLTEPYEHDDKCHKLVAAIISQQSLR